VNGNGTDGISMQLTSMYSNIFCLSLYYAPEIRRGHAGPKAAAQVIR
jgi:hypothetical protein